MRSEVAGRIRAFLLLHRESSSSGFVICEEHRVMNLNGHRALLGLRSEGERSNSSWDLCEN